MSRIILCLFCAGVATWLYITLALPACPDCLQVTQNIATGTADGPFVYRVLTPRLLVALGNTREVQIAFHFTGLLVCFLLLWSWVERWGGDGRASVALVTVALAVMYPTFYFSSYAITELILCLCGLLWLTGRWSPLAHSIGK